jgi:hypothetical protein
MKSKKARRAKKHEEQKSTKSKKARRAKKHEEQKEARYKMTEDYYVETLVRSIDEGISGKWTNDWEFPIEIVNIIATDVLEFNEKNSVKKIESAWLKYKKEKCEECGTMRRSSEMEIVPGCYQNTMYCCWKTVCKKACVMECKQCKKKQDVAREHFAFNGQQKFKCVECNENNEINVYQDPRTCAYNAREDMDWD